MAVHGITRVSVLILGILATYSVGQVKSTIVINTTTIEIKPYVMVNDVEVSGKITQQFSGYIVDLLEEITKHSGIDFKLNLVSDGRFGAFKHGQWTGMMGALLAKEADMVAAPLTVSEYRRDAVKFSLPFQVARLSLLVRRPENIVATFADRVLDLLKPLQQAVWIYITVAYFVTSISLYIIARFNPYGWRTLYKDGLATIREKESFDCANTFWFTLSTLMWQGFVRSPRSVGARIVTLAWWVFVVFTLILYTASLTNMIHYGPSSEATSRIQSFDDISVYDDVSINYIRGGATEHLIGESDIFSVIRSKSSNDSGINSTEVCVDNLRKNPAGKHVCVLESFFAQIFSGSEPCDLYTVEDSHNIKFYSFAYRPGFKYEKEIDKALISLRHSGKLASLYKRYFKSSCSGIRTNFEATHEYDEPRHKEKKNYTITLASFSGALVLLAIGIILGAIVTVIEIAVFRFVELPPADNQDLRGSGEPRSHGVGYGAKQDGYPQKDPDLVETNV